MFQFMFFLSLASYHIKCKFALSLINIINEMCVSELQEDYSKA